MNKGNPYPPESDEGCIEYKRMISGPSQRRLEHLVTQMNYRLNQGDGKAIYRLGINDNGSLANITYQEMQSSIDHVLLMASKLGAKAEVSKLKDHVEVTIIKEQTGIATKPEIRIAVVGKSNAGKSTLVGFLDNGKLDDGQGFARISLLTHYHELNSGMTSTTSAIIIGLNKDDEIVHPRFDRDLFREADRLVAILDLPGNKKFLRTALGGLTANHPEFGIVVVSQNETSGLSVEDYLSIFVAFDLPTVVVLNKTDNMIAENYETKLAEILAQINEGGKIGGKIGKIVKKKEDLFSAIESNCIPLIGISLFTGSNVDLVTSFLSGLKFPPPSPKRPEECEFRIIRIFNNKKNKIIVGGTLKRGTVSVGQVLLLGPFDDREFLPITVDSLHRWKVPCSTLTAVKSRISIAFISSSLCGPRIGQVLVASRSLVLCRRKFVGRIVTLKSSSTFKVGDISTIFMEGIRQTALLEELKELSEYGKVFVFKFCNFNEAIHVGAKFIVFDGQHKAHGEVLPDE